MNKLLTVCGLVFSLAVVSLGHPTGAPSSTCDDESMEPIYHRIHLGAVGYNNTDQYTLQAQPRANNPNEIEVTLAPNTGSSFKGFVIRATTTDGSANTGSFASIEGEGVEFNVLTCSSSARKAVTQKDPSLKSSVKFLWTGNNAGGYTFQATVVPEISSYVINIFQS